MSAFRDPLTLRARILQRSFDMAKIKIDVQENGKPSATLSITHNSSSAMAGAR